MGRRPAGPAGQGTVRPRYGRITSALGSVTVTAVAILGATGALPGLSSADAPVAQGRAQGAVSLTSFEDPPQPPAPPVVDVGLVTPGERLAALGVGAEPAASDVLPADSGSGRRVVFSMSDQRVWLVGRADRVRRTYLVSGSLTDNLKPGSYEVYSTSREAIGIDDSGTMNHMVRFAHGERAAIGFHDIPVKDGRRLQTRAELGTPQSSGCIRQARPDAKALWDFAPVGTTVVVVA